MKKDSEITMKNIADAMGLSLATVSRALHNHPHINVKTKARVKETARKLGYRYNAVAASLRKSKSNTIGLIVPRISRYYQASVITAIQNKLHDAKYNLMICQSNESPELEEELVNALYASRVEGLIVSTTLHTTDFSAFDTFAESSKPLVFFDRVPRNYPAHKITGDDYQGGYKSTVHLIEQGCRRIAHIGGTQTCNIYRERFEGYSDALKKFEIELDEKLIFFHDLTAENAINTFEKLLNFDQLPDGIFACNDTTAITLLSYARKMGINFPDDIKISGYSNDPLTQVVHPSITSVEQHPYKVGEQAAELILSLINETQDPTNFISITIPVDLVKRDSTKVKGEIAFF